MLKHIGQDTLEVSGQRAFWLSNILAGHESNKDFLDAKKTLQFQNLPMNLNQ